MLTIETYIKFIPKNTSIADKKKKTLFTLLADPEMSVWRKHEINRSAANLNSHLYKKKLTTKTVTELEDIAILLKRYNLSVEGVTQG